jgi:hypothetical protein
MRVNPQGVCLFLLLFSAAIAGDARADLDDIIEATFRNAVTKVDVSSNTPVIRNNVNVCNSQGTAFLIASSYAATAAHVLEIDPECGKPVILLRSRKHNVTLSAQLVKSKDDIAVLKVDRPFPASMCALRLKGDVYDASAYRFGIPGKLQDPAYLKVKIGEKDSEFAPFVRLTATPAEHGESGGPVIHNFNVVGVLKAKHKEYVGYSFMMVGSILRSLIADNQVETSGRTCNPVELNTSTDFASSTSLRPNNNLSPAAQSAVLAEIEKASSAAVERVSDIRFSQVGDLFSISASDKEVIKKVCTTFGPFQMFCSDRKTTVPGVQTAVKTAGDIRDDVTGRLWRQLTGESPTP